MSILNEIATSTRLRVNEQKHRVPLDTLRTAALDMPKEAFLFEEALGGCACPNAGGAGAKAGGKVPPLQSGDIKLICEIKKASPSKGVLCEKFDYLHIAKAYESAGAAAISVLTEPKFFQGDLRYMEEISHAVRTPLLMKDFVIDEYMLYEGKIAGANAVLLIAGLLSKEELARFLTVADLLRLSALVETHDEKEIETALSLGARVIGVNNRDLKDFSVDLSLTEKLRKYVPADKIFVSESGIKEPADIKRLRACGVNAALVGEAFMKVKDKKAEYKRLLGIE